MPTVLREGPYRYYFVSNEGDEPPHIHVDRVGESAKFWLEPVELARNIGFSARELGRIRRSVIERQAQYLEAWHDCFGQA